MLPNERFKRADSANTQANRRGLAVSQNSFTFNCIKALLFEEIAFAL